MDDLEVLTFVVDNLGGRQKVAKLLGVTPVAVHYWVTGQEPLPMRRALQLAQLSSATGHSVSLYDLRSDLVMGGNDYADV